MNKSPFHSLKGAAFQTSGTHHEIKINIRAALGLIRRYVSYGGASTDAEIGMRYIEQECPKVQLIINDMRMYLFDYDKFDSDDHKKLCLQLCSDLEKRVGEKPL